MSSRQTVVRCAALLLLLFAAIDVFGVDLFAPTLCGSPGSQASGTAFGDGDDCFCCCGHIVFATSPQLEPADSRPWQSSPALQNAVSADLRPIYHPPRS